MRRRRSWIVCVGVACALALVAAWWSTTARTGSPNPEATGSDTLPVRFDIAPEAILADGRAKSLELVPLVFYSTKSLSALEIDLATVRLSGAPLPSAASGEYACVIRDVNDDGANDLVCELDVVTLLGGARGKVVTIEARTKSGRPVRSQQYVEIRQ